MAGPYLSHSDDETKYPGLSAHLCLHPFLVTRSPDLWSPYGGSPGPSLQAPRLPSLWLSLKRKTRGLRYSCPSDNALFSGGPGAQKANTQAQGKKDPWARVLWNQDASGGQRSGFSGSAEVRGPRPWLDHMLSTHSPPCPTCPISLSSQKEGNRSFRAPGVHALNWILQGKVPQK